MNLNKNNFFYFSVNAVSLQPRSVGIVTINSTNPFDPPLLYPNFFAHPDDMVMIKDAARYVHDIFYTKVSFSFFCPKTVGVGT